MMLLADPIWLDVPVYLRENVRGPHDANISAVVWPECNA